MSGNTAQFEDRKNNYPTVCKYWIQKIFEDLLMAADLEKYTILPIYNGDFIVKILISVKQNYACASYCL